MQRQQFFQKPASQAGNTLADRLAEHQPIVTAITQRVEHPERPLTPQLQVVLARLLASATPMTTPIEKGNRTLYRARFAGFDAKRAADTCLELRRAAIDCFVMKAE